MSARRASIKPRDPALIFWADDEIPEGAKPNGALHVEQLSNPSFREIHMVKSYGWLRELRVTVAGNLMNMDASAPMRFEVALTDGMGRRVPVVVTMVCESVGVSS